MRSWLQKTRRKIPRYPLQIALHSLIFEKKCVVLRNVLQWSYGGNMRRSAHVVYMIIVHIYVIISYVLFNDFRLAECIPKRNVPLITNGQRHLTIEAETNGRYFPGDILKLLQYVYLPVSIAFKELSLSLCKCSILCIFLSTFACCACGGVWVMRTGALAVEDSGQTLFT